MSEDVHLGLNNRARDRSSVVQLFVRCVSASRSLCSVDKLSSHHVGGMTLDLSDLLNDFLKKIN